MLSFLAQRQAQRQLHSRLPLAFHLPLALSKRTFTQTVAIMAVTKTILKEGNGSVPNVDDTVTMEYTGYLKDTSKPDNKGAQYVWFQ
jgi:FKBP-type peptidyl-prolyl cis-trans isomerase